jgi:hypothetical protein
MQTAVGAVHSGLALQENFWSIVAQSELELIKAVRSLAVQSVHEEVMASFDDLHKRIGSARLWGYVHDEARFMLVPYNKLLVAKHARHAGHELEREAVAQLLRQLESFANLSGSDG